MPIKLAWDLARISQKAFHEIDYLVTGLAFDESVPYELKAVEAIHPKHRSQTLNYLMLTGLAHAKIINMRCSSMEYEFVSTTISRVDRYAFRFHFDSWRDLDADSSWLREAMRGLIEDWGLFLDVTLFYDAIEHLRGGKGNVVQLLDIMRGNQVIGRQFAHLMNPRLAFKITAISKD